MQASERSRFDNDRSISFGKLEFKYSRGMLRDSKGRTHVLSRRAREVVEALLDNERALEMADRAIAFHAASSARGVFAVGARRASALSEGYSGNVPYDLSSSLAADALDVGRPYRRVPARLEFGCADIAESLIDQTKEFREIQERVEAAKESVINDFIGDIAHEYGLAMGVPFEEAKRWVLDNVPGASFVERWAGTAIAADLANTAFTARLALTVTVGIGYMQPPPCWPSNMVADVW